jgi:Putative peptidoglycan binding domain
MKKIFKYTLLALVTGLYSCQTMSGLKDGITNFKDKIFAEKVISVNPADLKLAGKLAIITADAIKSGRLESDPYVKVNPEGLNLENNTDYKKFTQRSVVILKFKEDPDGTCSQSMMSESSDKFGRIDMSYDRIVYKLRPPTRQEVNASKASYLEFSRAMKGMDKESRDNHKKAIAAYQKSKGLTADGILGPKTVESILMEVPIIDVQQMSSRIVYPKRPRHDFYVLPFDTVAQDPDRFNKGFESLEAVKKNSLSRDQFKEVAEPGNKFVLFVYFVDRCDPDASMQVGFSNTPKRPIQPMSPKRYAVPGKWPVLIESFEIDKKLENYLLYANLFTSGKPLLGKTKITQCIGSCRLK